MFLGFIPTWIIERLEDTEHLVIFSQQAIIEISYFSSISLKSQCQLKAGSIHHWGLILCLTLQCRHNGHDGVSNHQPNHFLVIHLFRCRSKKTSKLRVTGLCEENSPVAGEFPAQRASNAENVSIWWRHHEGALSGDICNARAVKQQCGIHEK